MLCYLSYNTLLSPCEMGLGAMWLHTTAVSTKPQGSINIPVIMSAQGLYPLQTTFK